jgi:hypothetical protein
VDPTGATHFEDSTGADPAAHQRFVSTIVCARSFLIFASLLLSLVFVELTARLVGVRSAYTNPKLFAPSAPTVYGNRPGFRGVYAGAFVRINRLGFRGPEVEPTAGFPRVLLLGDSVAFGQAVDEELTVGAQFQQMLRNSVDQRVVVYNAGVPGFNTENEAVLLQTVGAILRPALVIVLYTDNDADDQLFVGFDGDYPVTREGHHLTERDVWHRISARLYEHSAFYNLLRLATFRLLSDSPHGNRVDQYRTWISKTFTTDKPGFTASLRALSEIRDWCEQNESHPLVAVFSRLPAGINDPFVAAVTPAFKRLGVPFVVLTPVSEHESSEDLTVPRDGHPNALAHRRMALQLFGATRGWSRSHVARHARHDDSGRFKTHGRTFRAWDETK